MNSVDYDIIIVGGGMVGMSMACALGDQALRVGLIEAHRPQPTRPTDTRCTALAYGSWQVFRHMGLWNTAQLNVTPIHQVHVSDQGHLGSTRIDHRQEHVDALGYVVENHVIHNSLHHKLSQYDNITRICPARVENTQIDANKASITILRNNTKQTLSTKLLIAADGGNSMIRSQSQIQTHTRDYQQTAIISTVTPRSVHQNIAYERFTAHGPIALLPLSNNRYSLVLTCPNDTSSDIFALTDTAFLRYLEHRFGYRTGGFSHTTPRVSYPLVFVRAKEHIRHRLALIGNAAQTLHPIAGQGFNLGIRDVATLAQIVVDAHRANQDIGHRDILETYARWRQQDHDRITTFTDTLARLFITRSKLLTTARSTGLILTNLLPPLKHRLAQQTMGMHPPWPKLTLGQPL